MDRFQWPILFIASACNRLIGQEHQAKHAKVFANATVVVIPGSGRMMFGEKPEESLRAVRHYLHS